METLLAYLAANEEVRFAVVFGSLAFALILEGLIPFLDFHYRKLRHVGTNLVFVITPGIVTGGIAYIAYAVIHIDQLPVGLWNLIALPLWLQVVLSLIVLDFFGQYFIHVCLYKYKWLWKLHLVHHR